MLIRRLSLLLLVLALVGCDSDPMGVDASTGDASAGDSGALDAGTPPTDAGRDAGSTPDAGPVTPPGELEITPGTPPLTVSEGTVFTTLSYGPGDRQELDVFFHPDAAEPTPVVIFIHGGGFTGGNRQSAYAGGTGEGLQYLVDQGLAYVSINYSLLALGSETEGVIKSLRDSRRALQFIRYYAGPLNIDPSRVALIGSSAGAGTSLWLAFHDDMADPSGDEIAQQSTRVTAAAVVATQATYELFRWPTDVFSPTYPLTVDGLLGTPILAAQVATFYGVSLALVNQPEMLRATLEQPQYVEYRQELDMLAWMSADDPPFYARNQASDVAPNAPGFDILHHPLHAQALADRAAEVGVTAIVEAPEIELGGMENSAAFLLEQLTAD
ncbi:MAG: carboxylesterase family protein [Sandaracinaceae bacterium]